MKVLLTGKPGVGKTTVVLRVLEGFQGKAGGFITQEVREGGARVGFKVKDLGGREAMMAHRDFPGPKVGRYGVSLETFESIALPALKKALEEADLVVIDEVGKMELFSKAFKDLVLRALFGEKPVLGTISLARDPFLERVKGMEGIWLLEVTPANRGALPGLILERLEESLR